MFTRTDFDELKAMIAQLVIQFTNTNTRLDTLSNRVNTLEANQAHKSTLINTNKEKTDGSTRGHTLPWRHGHYRTRNTHNTSYDLTMRMIDTLSTMISLGM